MKIKTFLNKIFRRTNKNEFTNRKVEFENTEFKDELKKYLRYSELKSTSQDYLIIINHLYTKDKIIYEEKKEEKPSEEKVIEEKVIEKIEQENIQFKSNFFNDYSMKILQNTDSKHLVKIACKSYVGDTDIPHDPERSFLILRIAKRLCTNEEESLETQFYLDYFRKDKASNLEDRIEGCENIINNTDYIKCKYISSRDLFKMITYNYNNTQVIPEYEKTFLYSKIHKVMVEASNQGIYEAYYFLGLMSLHGYSMTVDPQKAFYLFSIAASYSHSLAYFELYKLLKNDVVNLNYSCEKMKKSVLYDYLKSSAEEGFIEAMHELGNTYLTGDLNKFSKLKALAWHRHACRNGYLLSYEPCGDILYTGGDDVQANKALSLVMYYCAYKSGLIQLKSKIENIVNELKQENEPIPEMVLI